MKVVDIAQEIYEELDKPSDLSVPPIAYWLRANIGKLNTAINKAYFVNDTTLEIMCLNPNDSTNSTYEEIDEDAKAILKLLYHVHYYDTQVRKNMLTYNTSSAIEVTSDGHTVRLVSPTEIGRALYNFRKNLGDELKMWINWYRTAKAVPRQVTGDDTVEGEYYLKPIYRRTYCL